MATKKPLGDSVEEIETHAVRHWGKRYWWAGDTYKDFRVQIKEVRLEIALRNGLKSWIVVSGRGYDGDKLEELVYLLTRQFDDRYTTYCVSLNKYL